jgi:Bacterial membrane protein YfhO
MPASEVSGPPRGHWVAPALGILLLGIFVAPVLDPGVQLYYRDTGRLYYPVKLFIARALWQGRVPLWDTMTEGGVSLLGQVTPGLLHPFTLLYAPLPFDVAFKLNHVLALLLGAAGAYRLGRRLGATPWASLAGAAAYGGSGYLVSMAASNLPYALGAGTVPLAVDALLGFVEGGGLRHLLWAGAALALVAYAGDPQSVAIAAMISAVWSLLRGKAVAGAPGALRGVASAALAGAVALCLAAPAVLPAVAQLRRSTRAQGVSAASRSDFANHPLRLLGLLVPRAFDDVPERGPESTSSISYFEEFFTSNRPAFSDSIILGAPALLFAAWAAWGDRRASLLGAGGLLFALASTGEALGIDRVLFAPFPGGQVFRYAEKLVAPASLLISLACALGVDLALAGTPRSAGRFAGGAALTAAGCGLLALLVGWKAPQLAPILASRGQTRDPALAARFLAEAQAGLFEAAALSGATSLVALFGALRPGRDLRALGAACCAASVFASSSGLLHVEPVAFVRGPFVLSEELVRRAGPSPGSWRLHVRDSPTPRVRPLPERMSVALGLAQALVSQYNSTAGIESVSWYFSASDGSYLRALREAPGAFLPLFGVRFEVDMPGVLEDRAALAAGFARMPPGYWVRELPVGPRAFLVGRVRRAADAGEALRAMAQPGFDPHREALVLGGPALPMQEEGEPVAARLRRDSAERISVEVEAPAPSLLVVAEHFDPGWRAKVDGQEADLVQVDLSAIGVSVPRGRHAVELRFRPVGLAAGVWVALGALAALGAARLLRRR